MSRQYMKPVRIYHGTDLAEASVYEADEFGKLKVSENGLRGVVVSALVKCSFTATESGSGSMDYLDAFEALDTVTINMRRLGMFCNNVQAVKLLYDYINSGRHMPSAPISTVASAAGDTAVVLYLPIYFAQNWYANGPKDLAGAIPVSEFRENCDFKVKIGTGGLGSAWSIKDDQVDLDVFLNIVYSERIPEPLNQEVVVRKYTVDFCELPIDSSRPTRIAALWVSDSDNNIGFDLTKVTAGDLTVDEKTIFQDFDGQQHWDAINQMDSSKYQYLYNFVSTFQGFMPVITPASFRDSIVARRSAWCENMRGTNSTEYYDIGMRLVSRPNANVRAAILRDMGVPDAIIQRARQEENDARNNEVSWVDNAPARIINPQEFEGQTESEIVVVRE